MKLFDYIFYKVYSYYRGEPAATFYPTFTLTLIWLSLVSILINSTELMIGRKILNFSSDNLFLITAAGSLTFSFALFYFSYVKKGRSRRIYFEESKLRKITGWILVILATISIFAGAIVLSLHRFDTL